MPQHKTKQKAYKKYSTELTNQQWNHLKRLLPTSKKQVDGPGRTPLDLREVINGILYWMRSGCSWSLLPNDYPNYKSVYHYFNTWSKEGIWQKIHIKLVSKVRKKANRKKRPTASCIDSQSVKTTQIGSERGYDAGKCTKGRKRFILVDTLGLLLALRVVAASVWEKAGAKPLIEKIWGDSQLKELCGKFREGNISTVQKLPKMLDTHLVGLDAVVLTFFLHAVDELIDQYKKRFVALRLDLIADGINRYIFLLCLDVDEFIAEFRLLFQNQIVMLCRIGMALFDLLIFGIPFVFM